MKSVSCDVISGGLSIGRALNCLNQHKVDKLNSEDIINETKRLDDAIYKSIEQLKDLLGRVVNKEAYSFIQSHITLLKDIVFYQEIVNFICREKCNAEFAFQTIINHYINNLEETKDLYLRERAIDIIDVKNRVLSNLFEEKLELKAKRSTILFVDELLPSQILNLNPNIKGIVALRGGKTSHSSILCSQMGISYVVANIEVQNDETVIIDAKNHLVIVDPTEENLCEYEYLYFDHYIDDSIIKRDMGEFNVRANISSNSEIRKVISNNLDGVGLYRTEFLFMAKGHFPTLEEQTAIYQEASEALFPEPIIIRTFDMGDDKKLPYLLVDEKKASNYFKYLGVFENQVRAIVKANGKGNLKIMFPMIESFDEFNRLRSITNRICKEESQSIEVGMMLETKEAINHLEDFKDVSFMSIGTNDLMSELYGINRLSVQNYDIYLNDLLSRLKEVVFFAKENQITLGVCGEIAAIDKYLVSLIDLGFRNFSVNIPNISNVLRTITKKRNELENKK